MAVGPNSTQTVDNQPKKVMLFVEGDVKRESVDESNTVAGICKWCKDTEPVFLNTCRICCGISEVFSDTMLQDVPNVLFKKWAYLLENGKKWELVIDALLWTRRQCKLFESSNNPSLDILDLLSIEYEFRVRDLMDVLRTAQLHSILWEVKNSLETQFISGFRSDHQTESLTAYENMKKDKGTCECEMMFDEPRKITSTAVPVVPSVIPFPSKQSDETSSSEVSTPQGQHNVSASEPFENNTDQDAGALEIDLQKQINPESFRDIQNSFPDNSASGETINRSTAGNTNDVDNTHQQTSMNCNQLATQERSWSLSIFSILGLQK